MPNPDSIALVAAAQSEGIKAVLVGGNAVNLHAYFRTTFDVDLLVPETETERWLSFFRARGYEVFHRTPNFIRSRFAADPSGALPVDLMLSDEETFAKIQQASLRRQISSEVSVAIPSALHLIAMKLHALRSPPRAEHGIDLQDVVHLIRTAQIDVSSKAFREIAERYGTDDIRRRIQRELGQ